MTELNAMAMFHHLDEPLELRKLAGINPAPGLEVRVVHPETGAVCKPGDEGELQFRGPRVTRGYYKKPEETAVAFTADGWFAPATSASRTETATRCSRVGSARRCESVTSSSRLARSRRF
jgi:fatty-acyl-CoA synthase